MHDGIEAARSDLNRRINEAVMAGMVVIADVLQVNMLSGCATPVVSVDVRVRPDDLDISDEVPESGTSLPDDHPWKKLPWSDTTA